MTRTILSKNRKFSSPGFTLIELLLVISIISLLASIVLASVSGAKAQASDVQKVSEAGQVQDALALYDSKNNTMPSNYDCSSSPCQPVTAPSTGIEVEGSNSYNASMQQLVGQGYLPSIPASPDHSYVYYNYGPQTPQGAVFGAALQVTNPANVMTAACYPTKFDPPTLYPDFHLVSNANQIYNYTTSSGQGSAQCQLYLVCGGSGCTSPGIRCVLSYTDGRSCTWFTTNLNFTALAPIAPTGNYCNPCTGGNGSFCTCNPY
jgi:prepilin-type N-terminal cleavage/methylation domain-containing protein